MIQYLKLVRLPNLLVVVLTQVLVYYHLIRPAFKQYNIDVQLAEWQFWLVSLACVLVTAAGYVINDILDAAGDAINRPGTNYVYALGLNNCRFLYLVLLLGGYAICLTLSFSTGQQGLLWLYPLICSMLALYSRYIKTKPFLGNLLVALLCAGVPGLIALAERKGLQALWEFEPFSTRLLVVYCCFAFLTTILRELIKDMEDLKGDQLMGRRTLPVILGMGTSTMLAQFLVIANLMAVVRPFLMSWPGFQTWPVISLIGIITILLVVVGVLLFQASTPHQYGRLSNGIKLVMLLGLLMLAVV